MKTSIQIVQIVSSILLIMAILTQNRGAGLSSTFGGEGGFYTSKRGVEKILSYLTIILGALFLVSSLLAVIIK
ncbi:preprotein translocase subunit SecG [Candidatus Peregrinibacteria bacterium]|nr:preprotein translocase subunit SecG [Candidatus Peregrinibacteria bacterium]